MRDSIRVFKLSNGESIIGSTLNNNELFEFNKSIQVSYPLKMVIVRQPSRRGASESLSLSPWVHPMTEEEYIDINANNVIMSAPASSGLIGYYMHCINQFDFKEEPYLDMDEPSDRDLDSIEFEEEVEAIEEALDELTDPNRSDTIH